MGMFDTVRSSYDLGKEFETELQTKDLDCLMNHYWIDPSGRLFEIDYSYTHDFVELKEGDDGYDSERAFFNFVWKPNGMKGKVRPVYICKYIRVYPAQWSGQWENWPERLLHVKWGAIIDVYDSKDQCPTTQP